MVGTGFTWFYGKGDYSDGKEEHIWVREEVIHRWHESKKGLIHFVLEILDHIHIHMYVCVIVFLLGVTSPENVGSPTVCYRITR